MCLNYINLNFFLQYNTFFFLATLPKYFKKSTIVYSVLEYNIVVKDLISVLSLLKKHSLFKFTVLNDIFVSDYLLKKENRFLVTYNLLSPKCNLRLNITLDLSLFKFLPTVSHIYKGSNWLERET
jgi:NADH:ubiquinone oxidoreductase subunit C